VSARLRADEKDCDIARLHLLLDPRMEALARRKPVAVEEHFMATLLQGKRNLLGRILPLGRVREEDLQADFSRRTGRLSGFVQILVRHRHPDQPPT
jgi:hypothetical protein